MKELLKKILPNPLLNVIKILKNFLDGKYNYFLWLFPIKHNKIVICNYYGNGYGDNGKYIAEEILKRGTNYDLVWLVKSNLEKVDRFPNGVRTVDYGSFRGLIELATAKIWVDNSRKFFYPPKRRNQYYIQTWHASMGIKKIEKDAENELSKGYVKTAQKDSKYCDLMLAGSEFRFNLYRNSFWYNGEILKSGTPRCDLFFHANSGLKEKILKEFNIPLHKKVVLYAPTFRNNVDIDFYTLSYEEIIDELRKRFGGDWIFFNRLHPNIANLESNIEYGSNVVNTSHYADMQELLAIADVLITDYSSSMFDMALQNKVCLLYAPDLDKYMNDDRGLYFDYKELPFSSATTLKELRDNIRELRIDDYKRRVDLFHKQIGIYEDGRASRRVVDRIVEICEE